MKQTCKSSLAIIASVVLFMALVAACGETEAETQVAQIRAATEATATQSSVPAAVSEAAPTSTSQAVTPAVPALTATPEPTAPGIPAVEPADTPVQADSDVIEDALPEPENPAPELLTTTAWYNTDGLSLAELRGGPVLLVFWNTH